MHFTTLEFRSSSVLGKVNRVNIYSSVSLRELLQLVQLSVAAFGKSDRRAHLGHAAQCRQLLPSPPLTACLPDQHIIT